MNPSLRSGYSLAMAPKSMRLVHVVAGARCPGALEGELEAGDQGRVKKGDDAEDDPAEEALASAEGRPFAAHRCIQRLARLSIHA